MIDRTSEAPTRTSETGEELEKDHITGASETDEISQEGIISANKITKTRQHELLQNE